jgi:glycine/D-amino acid oxidase-like deaminating enzyme
MSMRVLICGGGVNGAAIAYLQSRRGVEAIFIHRPRLACAASAICGLSTRPISPSRPQAATQEPDHRMRGTFD